MNRLIPFLFLLLTVCVYAQEEENDDPEQVEITEITDEIVPVNRQSSIITADHLTEKNPMRASLYSAILPGMGQIYNNKWWKAPLVWGVLGTGVGFIIHFNSEYKETRGYYLDKLYGNPIDNPTINSMSAEQLATIQDTQKRNRDYAIALTTLGYILNILDATVDAHLFGIKKDPDLSMEPVILQNQQTMEPAMGIGFNLKF